MQVFHSLSALPAAAQSAVVALGNFDGFHLGHQAVIAETKRIAEAAGAPVAVLTFSPHPREFFRPEAGPLSIYDVHTKLALLKRACVDIVYLARFDAAFSQLSAEDFIQKILVDELHARHVVTGENFIFGHQRGGDATLLKRKAQELGFVTTQLAGVQGEGVSISSTRIRDHLARGEMAEASALLGRPHAISGHVQHGDKRGRDLGFPTANLSVAHIFKPKFGIYAVRTNFGPGAASLGVRPTVGGDEPLLEVHLFEPCGDIYGKTLETQLVAWLRPEEKFESLEAMQAQMAKDCAKAQEIL